MVEKIGDTCFTRQQRDPEFVNFQGINIWKRSLVVKAIVLADCCQARLPPAAQILGQNFLDLNLSIVGQSK